MRSDELARSFEQQIDSADGAFILIPSVLLEIADGDRPDRIKDRCDKLLRWWNALGDERFLIVPDIQDMVVMEFDREAMNVPLCLPAQKSFFRQVLSFHDKSAIKQYVTDGKNSAWELDSDVHQISGIQKIVSDDHAKRQLLREITTWTGPDDQMDFLLEGLLKGRNVRIPKLVEINRNASRYPVSRLFAWVGQLNMYGAMFDKWDSDHIINAFRPERGNWYDAAIIGSAALCDIFVVDDINAYKRAKFSAEQGIARFKVQTTLQWLA